MSKGRHITRLTPAACEEIQSRMIEACRKIAADHGLVIEGAGWRGLDSGFSFEPVFRVSVPASDGTAFNLEKDMFEFLAARYGLAPSDLGREFSTGSERFRITGIDPKRPLGRSELKRFSEWNDGRPETELNFKFYRQATNKIVGISDEAATFLGKFF